MPSLDINFDYKKIQNKINATKSYTDIKSQYNDANKKVGETTSFQSLPMYSITLCLSYGFHVFCGWFFNNNVSNFIFNSF